MISCFSIALIGAFRSLLFHSVICSLGGPLSHGSPVVFFDRGHPRFEFYSTIPVDFVRVKSYMNVRTALKQNLISGESFNHQTCSRGEVLS